MTHRDAVLALDFPEDSSETFDRRVMPDMSDRTDTASSSRLLLLVKSLGSGLSPISNCFAHIWTTAIRSSYIESDCVLCRLLWLLLDVLSSSFVTARRVIASSRLPTDAGLSGRPCDRVRRCGGSATVTFNAKRSAAHCTLCHECTYSSVVE